MCRNIRTLYNYEPPATAEKIEAAALQYVRKVSGFRQPSKVNQAVFEQAVTDIAAATQTLMNALVTNATPRDREAEAAKAKARAARRFARTN